MDKVYDRVPSNWFTSYRGVDSHEFMVEAKCWLSILCARVIPSAHDIEVTLDPAIFIAAFSDVFKVNIG